MHTKFAKFWSKHFCWQTICWPMAALLTLLTLLVLTLATATDNPLLTLPLSIVSWCAVGWLWKPKKLKNLKNYYPEKEEKIVSQYSKIRDTLFDQHFFWPPKFFFCNGANGQTEMLTLWLTRPIVPSCWK